MPANPSSIEELLTRLAAQCEPLGLTIAEALGEKASELELRTFLRCVPNSGIKTSQLAAFLTELLGAVPAPDLLDQVTREERGPSLDPDEYMQLEQRQGGRCALCGTLLFQSAHPQVDHIVPVALGGKSTVENYQLLCQRCNIGKSKLIGWIMGAPFLDEGQSTKLRYCVLTRYRGRCSLADCGNTAYTSEIDVVPRIPVQRGGRFIFDNLRTLCREHAVEQSKKWYDEAASKVRGLRLRGSWRPLAA